MIFGIGQAVFKIYDATPTLIDTITITYVNKRDNNSFEARQSLNYTNPFTLARRDVFRGYYIDESLVVTADDYRSTLANYHTRQQTASTENDVYKAFRLQDYFDQGYTIRYIRHTDAEGVPWNYYHNVEVRLSDLDGQSIYNDTVVINLLGAQLIESHFANPLAAPANQPTSLNLNGVCNAPNTKVTGSFTGVDASDGNKWLVVYKAGSAPTFTPTDNVTYTAGQDVGGSTFVIQSSSSTSFEQTGIAYSTTVHVAVFAYLKGTRTLYNITAPLTGNVVTPSMGACA